MVGENTTRLTEPANLYGNIVGQERNKVICAGRKPSEGVQIKKKPRDGGFGISVELKLVGSYYDWPGDVCQPPVFAVLHQPAVRTVVPSQLRARILRGAIETETN